MKRIQGLGYYPGWAFGRIHVGIPRLLDIRERVIVLNEYLPDELFELLHRRPAGVVLVGHGRLSHLAIYLCSLGLVTISLEESDSRGLADGDRVLIDGREGLLILGPSEEELSNWQTKPSYGLLNHSQEGKTRALNGIEPFTSDGVKVIFSASIASLQGAAEARAVGASSIGLLRSEFFFSGTDNPAEAESSYSAIRAVIEESHSSSAFIRLLDVGGEKIFGWLPRIGGTESVLGLRGARLYRQEKFKPMLKAQIRALDRLAQDFKISLIIPYLTSAEEFILLKDELQELIAEDISIGAMVETPAICYDIPGLAGKADFVSIGTNDLMQCFFGADRSLAATSRYLDPYSPALWRFLDHLGNSCSAAGLDVTVCGELPTYPHAFQLLIGLGFRKFSVAPLAIPYFRTFVRDLSGSESRKLADLALGASSSTELKSKLLTSFEEGSESN